MFLGNKKDLLLKLVEKEILPIPTAFFMEELNVQSIATQRKTNIHKKYFEKFVDSWIIDNKRMPVIVEIGAGLGLNVKNLKEKNIPVISVEPFVDVKYWGNEIPDYSFSSEVPHNLADIVYCSYVLNVLTEDVAKGIVQDIIDIMKQDGVAYIVTRGEDVKSATPVNHLKYGKLMWSPLEFVTKSKGKLTYQKGFTNQSLKDLILSVSNSVCVEKHPDSKSNSVKVLITKRKWVFKYERNFYGDCYQC